MTENERYYIQGRQVSKESYDDYLASNAGATDATTREVEVECVDSPAPQNTTVVPRGFKWTDRVPDGGLLRPWHGAVRYEADRCELITAIIPLNLIGRALYRILFFLKMGGQSVNIDPRQAFHDGQLIGRKEAEENMPKDLQLQRMIIEAASQRADRLMRRFGEHGMLQEKQHELDAKIQDFLDDHGSSDKGEFPSALFEALQAEKASVVTHADGAVTL